MNTNLTSRLFGGIFLLLSASISADAAFLSPQQSLSRAESTGTIRKMPGSASFTLAHTEKSDGEAFLYIFNKGENGFIITSADDRMAAVLGYSDRGAFNPSDASPELKWWLSQYAAEASASLKTATASNHSSPVRRSAKKAVPELLSTRWDQGSPYNLDCPSDAGGKCVTGCVATAMAQVIKYFGYPYSGNGSYSYNWQGTTLHYDYAGATFDYQNMLDEYDYYYDNASQTQKAAVANLMYACGVGVNMNYTSNSSGASDAYVAYALAEYFNYDKSIRYLKRDCLSAEEWENIIYEELLAERPVIYGGQSYEGGHEFVCDGYEEGYFHINWGWSGYGNGWFLLSALDPGLQGIGGFAGGYNFDQSIICGIQPNAGNQQTTYPIFATGGLEVREVYGNEAVMIGITDGGVWNYSPAEFETSLYLKAVSTTDEEYVGTTGMDVSFPGCQGTSIRGFTAFPAYLPSVGDGSYKVYVMYRGPQGNLLQLPVPLTEAYYLNMTVDASGNVSFGSGTPDEKATIVVTELSPLSTVYSNQATDFSISIQNTSNVSYSGPIYIRTYAKDSEEMLKDVGVNLSLAPGQTLNGYVSLEFDLPDGEYDLKCYDKYEEVCSDIFPLQIGEKVIEAAGISLDVTEKTLTEGDTFIITATIDPETTTDKTVTWSSSNTDVATVENGKVIAIAPGTAVITASTPNGLEASCSVTVTEKIIEATGISLDVTEKTLTEGDTFIITATIDPETTTDKTVTWTSSNTEVATVDNGKVTAIAPGTAVITASTSNDLQASCSVTVTAKIIEAQGITLDVTEKTMIEGDTFIITATIDPETTTDKTVTWSSSNTDVATVENGKVTAIAPGTAVITASTSNGLEASCSVTVKAKIIEAAGISLDVTEKTLTEGDTFIITATIDPETTTDKTLTWSSSNTEVATVENGQVTAISPGTAVITASTSNGLEASCSVTVTARIIEAAGISLDVTEKTLTEGDTFIITATIDPETTTDKTVTWSSSNTEVATVDNGKVTAIAPGSAVITASTANGLQATCNVTVTARIIEAAGISLDVTEKTLTEGDTFIITATIDPETTTDKTVTWTSSNTEVATVDNGKVTAIAPGTAVITASTSNGLQASCSVTVTAKIIEAAGISLDVTEKTLTEGDTFTITATIDPETTTDKTVTWSSSNTEVATVDNGKVTAIAPGTATITASTTNGLTAQCNVTVTAKIIEAAGISLDVTEKTLTEGDTFIITATIDPETTTDKTVTWSSSNTDVATVENGKVTAIAPGTAVITASTANGLEASCSVTVTAKIIEAVGISLDVTEKTLTEGDTFIITATIDPETTTDKTVTWSSSNTEVATVENGKVTAIAPGTAVITASTSNGLTAQCNVTVEKKIILATSITLDKTSVEAEAGTTVTLTATVLPDDATDKTVAWSSSDESVATVDQEGNVTIIALGFAIITAETTDGSNLYAECSVNGISYVQSLVIESGNVDIFTLDGIIIRKNADQEYVSNLARGTYIIRTANKVFKIVK